jgi:hypothetical protein
MLCKRLVLFFLVLIVASCSQQTAVIKSSEEKSCKPDISFTPSSIEISSEGLFILKGTKSNFNYDLKNKNWTCRSFQSPLINSFYGKDAKQMSYALIARQTDVSDIMEQDLNVSLKTGIRDFVTRQCQLIGLSYLFEIKDSLNVKIFGCQINPKIDSAIMWKAEATTGSLQIAYLPLYQPFVSQLLRNIESGYY